MIRSEFALSLPQGPSRRLALSWLVLALASLVGAGLVVILILLARTPWIHPLFPWIGTEAFRTALVVHVDLSVLVWFLAFAGLLSRIILAGRALLVGYVALIATALGMVLLAFSPFLGAGIPYMNNYVPVLANEAFFAGLLLVCGGFALMALQGVLATATPAAAAPGEIALRYGVKTALAIGLLACLSWGWSTLSLPEEITGEHRYEILFWAGGHILQFTHTQLLFVVWFWLISAFSATLPITPRVAVVLLTLGALPTLAGPLLQYLYPVDSIDHRMAFSWLMQYGGALASLPIGLAVAYALLTTPPPEGEKAVWYSLLFSLILYGVGGVIGFLIQSVNVTIPAHYHGSIVAVTMAYMGLTYYLLPRWGLRPPHPRWSTWQPLIYGGGALIHVFGLAWSGTLGIQRKTAGTAQGLNTLTEQIAMGITGVGGFLSTLGGVIFLVLVFRAMWPEKQKG